MVSRLSVHVFLLVSFACMHLSVPLPYLCRGRIEQSDGRTPAHQPCSNSPRLSLRTKSLPRGRLSLRLHGLRTRFETRLLRRWESLSAFTCSVSNRPDPGFLLLGSTHDFTRTHPALSSAHARLPRPPSTPNLAAHMGGGMVPRVPGPSPQRRGSGSKKSSPYSAPRSSLSGGTFGRSQSLSCIPTSVAR